MFEDEDWNINEDDFNSDDIFNDNNDKAEKQLLTKNEEIKKQSSVLLNSSGLQCNPSGNLENNVTVQPNESISVSQKKVVLDIFKKNSSSQQVPKINEQKSLIVDNEKPLECSLNVTNERGKNLILNVFQKNVEKSKPIVKSVMKISEPENKFKRKKNVAFADSPGESNLAKKVCTEKVNKSQESRKNDDIYINQENQNLPFETSDSSRGGINNYSKRKFVDLQRSPVHKSFKVPRVKQAVVRQFPGPAGILPDDIDENVVIEIDSLDENKNDKSNQYADICSQNTKNLFSTGAWQLMMDDLPADFELYDIATIKENALEYSKTYKKIPYLAGIVQCVDYKPSDPHIILKDLTGRIDARIHHSICKLYPNALGTNVVILAKDVGLVVSKKFVCLIISLNNLVSIYSDEARLVETPHLKSLVQDNSANQNMDESQISVLGEIECHNNNEASKTHSRENENRLEEQSGSKNKCNIDRGKDEEANSEGISELNVIRKDNDMDEFNLDENDSWLSGNVDELSSFKPDNFPSSTPLDSNEQNSSKGHFQIKQSKNVESKKLPNTPESKNISNSKLSTSTGKQKTISDRLSIFRNTNYTSESSTTPKESGSTEKILPIINKPLESEGNDTDDEILSQLDVDAIAASYQTQNS